MPRLIDCLIAAIALRSNLSVLHQDADFEALRRHTGLKLHPPPAA